MGWGGGAWRGPRERTKELGPPLPPRSSPEDLLLALLHPIQETLQLTGSLAIYKALPDTGIQAPGELRKEMVRPRFERQIKQGVAL